MGDARKQHKIMNFLVWLILRGHVNVAEVGDYYPEASIFKRCASYVIALCPNSPREVHQ